MVDPKYPRLDKLFNCIFYHVSSKYWVWLIFVILIAMPVVTVGIFVGAILSGIREAYGSMKYEYFYAGYYSLSRKRFLAANKRFFKDKNYD